MEPNQVNKANANISAIRNEAMNAASSLNMPPELRPDFDQMTAFYMTDMYVWAQHAHEHVIATMQNTEALRQALNEVSWALRLKGDFELSHRLEKLTR